MKLLEYLLFVSLLVCGIGLFLDWVGIDYQTEIPSSNAFISLSGLYIFFVVILVGLQIVRAKKPFHPLVNLLLLIFIPLLAIYNFYFFKVNMNISSQPDLDFSIRNVKIGFYVTLISSIISIIIYIIYTICLLVSKRRGKQG